MGSYSVRMKRIAYTNPLEALLDLFGPILYQNLTENDKNPKMKKIQKMRKTICKKVKNVEGEWSKPTDLLICFWKSGRNMFGKQGFCSPGEELHL